MRDAGGVPDGQRRLAGGVSHRIGVHNGMCPGGGGWNPGETTTPAGADLRSGRVPVAHDTV